MSYDSAEQSTRGGSPVELYEFTHGSSVWRYTSADEAQIDGAMNVYDPAVISRGAIDMSDEDTQGGLEVTLLRTDPVAALFIPSLPAFPVRLTVTRFHRDDGNYVQLWSGEIASAMFSADGARVRLSGLPVGAVLRRKIPGNTFQGQCNWALFSPQCGLAKASYRVPTTVNTVTATGLVVASVGGHASGYFRTGWAENAAGERRWITDQVGTTLTLFSPFSMNMAGQAIDLYPGCDRTLEACAAFSNLARFCGFPFIPGMNPFSGRV